MNITFNRAPLLIGAIVRAITIQSNHNRAYLQTDLWREDTKMSLPQREPANFDLFIAGRALATTHKMAPHACFQA